MGLEEPRQDDEADDGCADDDSRDGFGPGFVSVREIWEVRKHLAWPFVRAGSLAAVIFLDAASGCAGYQHGSVGRAEAVVYIYYGNVGGTGVEHSQKGSGAVEAGSVADRGGDGDDRDTNEASDDAWESALHASADDDGVGGGELVADAEKTVEAGDSDVVETRDGGVEEIGGDGSLFGDALIAGAGAEDCYVAFGCVRGLAESDSSGSRVMDGCGNGGEDGFGRGIVDAGGEDVGAGGGHAGEDFGCLLRGFILRVDDFGEAGAEGSVVVDASVAEVFVGEIGESLGGGGGGEGAGLNGGKDFEERCLSHLRC